MQDRGQWWLMSKMSLWWASNCRDNNSCFLFFQQSEISSPTPRKGFFPILSRQGKQKQKSTPDNKSLCSVRCVCVSVCVCVCVICPWRREWIALMVLAAQSKGPRYAMTWLPWASLSVRRSSWALQLLRLFLVKCYCLLVSWLSMWWSVLCSRWWNTPV